MKIHSFHTRTTLAFVFSLAFVFQTTPAQAAGRCLDLFKVPVQHAFSNDPVAQLMLWEQTSNQTRWYKPTEPVQLGYTEIPADKVVVRTETYTPEIIHSFFKTETLSHVRWMKHPLNRSLKVPYIRDAEQGHKQAFFSASRSMFTTINNSLFSLKLPTDYPHPGAAAQPDKADLNNDSIISMRRSKHIRDYDARFGSAENLYVLTEVISVASKLGNAFSVRDLRPLQDGNYYLPAFSIPYAGREIAKLNNAHYSEFWKEHYGANLGKAKAQLLLRYGLQMKTPNAQNWLIQLDKNMAPTGRIYMRDVADSNYVDFVADHNGSFDLIQADRKVNFSTGKMLRPNWENSAWQMDEGKVFDIVLHSWGAAHDAAYVKTIKDSLKLEAEITTIKELETFLKTPAGGDALYMYDSARRRSHLLSQGNAA